MNNDKIKSQNKRKAVKRMLTFFTISAGTAATLTTVAEIMTTVGTGMIAIHPIVEKIRDSKKAKNETKKGE